MDVVWHGHSCFRLRGREAVVVTDPYDNSLGLPPLRLTADIVTISHQHPHHSHLQAVGGEPRVVDGPGEYEIAATFLNGVRTYHDAEKGAKFGRNTAYVISLDDVLVCHLGDLGHVLNSAQIEALEGADVLLIPVGGNCALNGAQAAEVVSQLDPKIVIPMHYQTGRARVELESVEKFCKEMGATELTPQPKLTISKSSVPETTTVVLLSPPG